MMGLLLESLSIDLKRVPQKTELTIWLFDPCVVQIKATLLVRALVWQKSHTLGKSCMFPGDPHHFGLTSFFA